MTIVSRSIMPAALVALLALAIVPTTGCGKKQTLQRPPIDPAPPALAEPAGLRTDTDQRGAYAVDVPVPQDTVAPTPTPAP